MEGGSICTLTFDATYPLWPPGRANELTIVSSFGELQAAASSIIETCVNGVSRNGGTAHITSTAEDEMDYIYVSVSDLISPPQVGRIAAKLSSLYKGERLLGGNPWRPGGPDPYGRKDTTRWDEPLSDPSTEQTTPGESAYCNANVKTSCWLGFRCDTMKLRNGLKSILWGLDMGKVADFIGTCIMDEIKG